MTTPAQTTPTTTIWQIDPVHSTIRFGVTHHAIATFRGGFIGVTGSYDGGKCLGRSPRRQFAGAISPTRTGDAASRVTRARSGHVGKAVFPV